MHMEVGQPSTGAPQRVKEAAKRALDEDTIGYTNAMGNLNLREKIAEMYKDKYNADVDAANVMITTGSSASFLMLFLTCFTAGDTVAVCSSGYPCYRNILKATEIEIATLQVNAQFKITAKTLVEEVERRSAAGEREIKGLILSSPGNPT